MTCAVGRVSKGFHIPADQALHAGVSLRANRFGDAALRRKGDRCREGEIGDGGRG